MTFNNDMRNEQTKTAMATSHDDTPSRKRMPLHARRSAPRLPYAWKLIVAVTIAMILVLVGTIGGVAWWRMSHQNPHDPYRQFQTTSVKPANSTSEGALPAYTPAEYNHKAPTVEIYVDFLCPTCGELSRRLDPTLLKMQRARQINLQFQIINFLDSAATKHYSTRAANALAYVADRFDALIGIDGSKVGDSNTLPSLGPQGKPHGMHETNNR